LLLVSFSVTCVLLVGYFVYLLLLKLRVRKPYSHFLSHSRVEAGATARWFQLALGKVLGGTLGVLVIALVRTIEHINGRNQIFPALPMATGPQARRGRCFLPCKNH